jgi:putative ABC transport system substrate-binding protein
MDRRKSVAALLALAAATRTRLAHAQSQAGRRPFRIGLVPDFDPGFRQALLRVLTETLNTFGRVEDRDYVYIHTGVFYGPETQLALERVLEAEPDLIVTQNLGYAVVARRLAPTIPVVMCFSGFPVEGGVAQSLTRPGWNVTGMTLYAGGEEFGKMVQLLHEAKPSVKRIGAPTTYVPPFHPRAEADLIIGGMRDAAKALGVDLKVYEVSTPEQVDSALAFFVRHAVEALVLNSGPSMVSRRREVLRFAIERRWPTMVDSPWADVVDPLPLLSYRPDYASIMQGTAWFVNRILWEGAKPGELPIQLPSRFVFTVNRKMAKAIGLAIPPRLLARADSVIE